MKHTLKGAIHGAICLAGISLAVVLFVLTAPSGPQHGIPVQALVFFAADTPAMILGGGLNGHHFESRSLSQMLWEMFLVNTAIGALIGMGLDACIGFIRAVRRDHR